MKKNIFLTFSTTPSSYRFLERATNWILSWSNPTQSGKFTDLDPRQKILWIKIEIELSQNESLSARGVSARWFLSTRCFDPTSSHIGAARCSETFCTIVRSCILCNFIICSALMIICFSWIPDQLKSVKCRELGNVHNVQGKIFDQWLRDPTTKMSYARRHHYPRFKNLPI